MAGGVNRASRRAYDYMQQAAHYWSDLANSGYGYQLPTANEGLLNALIGDTTEVTNQNYNASLPIETSLQDILLGALQPSSTGYNTPDALSPVMSAYKLQGERNAAQAGQALRDSGASGGAYTAGLLNVLNNQSDTMAQARGNVAQDVWDKAYTYGSNTLPRALAGLSAAGGLGSTIMGNQVTQRGQDLQQKMSILNAILGGATGQAQTTASFGTGQTGSNLGGIGAGLGALAGTFFMPGAGTAIGAQLGSMLGGAVSGNSYPATGQYSLFG